MLKNSSLLFCLVSFFAVSFCVWAAEQPDLSSKAIEIARYEDQISFARIQPARMKDQKGLAVIFEGTGDLHYYAKQKTAPGGYKLTIEAKSDDFVFDEAVFPRWEFFSDPVGKNVEVYVGNFIVFIPIKSVTKGTLSDRSDVVVKITGIACTSKVCLQPFEKNLQRPINWVQSDSWEEISFKTVDSDIGLDNQLSYSIWYALGLAFLAGLSLNIMPCVWPVLPIVVLRIVEQAKKGKGKKITMGISFCLGILLFFACLAAANIILQLTIGTALQWGDQFRNPSFVIGMAFVLIVLALFMFDVFTITVPASVSGRSGSGEGYLGTVGMGFLAAVLSTPCSFGILAAAFAWAQGQLLLPATTAIMFIGFGMAVPYLILTSIPGLIERLPKPGRWMDLFKKFVGFILLAIAAWMVTVVPSERRSNVLFFAVVLSFCVWMWGGWVGYGSKTLTRLIVRVVAIALAVSAGWWFLSPKVNLIEWQKYDTDLIETSLKEQRPVLMKFTADWCMSCKVVEKVVYSRKDIAQLINDKKVLAIKADTTVKDYPATLALKNKYKEPGVPVSILILPDQEKRWRDKSFADELKGILEKLP